MHLSAEATIPFPRSCVFEAYRDRLPELLPYLPNIRAIEVMSRRDTGTVTELVNLWHGMGEIPAAARAFLDERLLSWTDHARWDQADWSCHWRMQTHVFTEAIHAEGDNRYTEKGGVTRLVIEGALDIDPKKLKGVPRLFAGTIAKAAEQIVIGRVKPNLLEVAAGVSRFLEKQAP
jgi:hypothetical protein